MSARYNKDGSRCCYAYKGTHIPGCWGCAIYGHSRCNCDPVRATHRELEDRVAALERLIATMMAVPSLPHPSTTTGGPA